MSLTYSRLHKNRKIGAAIDMKYQLYESSLQKHFSVFTKIMSVRIFQSHIIPIKPLYSILDLPLYQRRGFSLPTGSRSYFVLSLISSVSSL